MHQKKKIPHLLLSLIDMLVPSQSLFSKHAWSRFRVLHFRVTPSRTLVVRRLILPTATIARAYFRAFAFQGGPHSLSDAVKEVAKGFSSFNLPCRCRPIHG